MKKKQLLLLGILVFVPFSKGFATESTTETAGSMLGIRAVEKTATFETIESAMYVSVIQDAILFDATFENEIGTSSTLIGKTFLATKKLQDEKKQTYYLLEDSQGKVQGFLTEKAVKIAKTPGGTHTPYGKYVIIQKNNQPIWKDFYGTQKGTTSDYYQQIVLAKGYYQHFDGKRYLSIYNSKNQWLGYLEETQTKVTNKQGAYRSYGETVIMRRNMTIYADFEGKKKGTSKTYLNQEFIAKGFYNHFNGYRYVSLYNQKNQWVGYINANAVEIKATKPALNYASLTKKNKTIYQNYEGKIRGNTTDQLNQTFKTTSQLRYYDGITYYTLVNKANKFQGYINAKDVTTSKTAQGTPRSVKEYVVMQRKNYYLYENFTGTKKQLTNGLFNQVFQVREAFTHFNGATYVSVFDQFGQWQGYLNANATKTVAANQFIDKEALHKRYLAVAEFKKGNATAADWKTFQATVKAAKQVLDLKTATQTQVNTVNSQLANIAPKQFVASIALEAKKIAKANDLYASVMLAQAILESGYGQSELAYQAKNFFGIKYVPEYDEGTYDFYEIYSLEYIKGEFVPIRSKFRKYPDISGSLKDNALKLSKGTSWDANYYKGAWRSVAKTYKQATKALTGKYATDPQYDKKLNSVIENWDLTQYD